MIHPELHIVAFAVPYPANYGGAIDVWNRLVALKSSGVSIKLHCFVYGTFKQQHILNEIAEEVTYYPRVRWPAFLSKGRPYIVTSRAHGELLKNLSADRSPILFEGIHTTAHVHQLSGRKLLLRAHNVEHQYYAALAMKSKGIKSLIFRRESLCLENYEKAMAGKFDAVFAISPADKQWYDHHGANTVFIPPFHGDDKVDILPGRGHYILYQGDLSIEINQEALLDLLARIPSNGQYPVMVAGRSGSKGFEIKLAGIANLTRHADVSDEKMVELVRNAQIILIHSLHGSGMKLKIFPALHHGRFVAATLQSMTKTPLDQAITYYKPDDLTGILEQLWPLEVTNALITERKEILARHPGDMEKAGEILRYL